MPFWIYIEVWKGSPGITPMDIVFNVMLLFPIGVLLAGLYPSMRIWRVFLIGFLSSLLIEMLQYFFYKGVAQLDDLVHNSQGCVLGWYLSKRCFLNKTL
jgi:glycopeptide antibiotics resistance protein